MNKQIGAFFTAAIFQVASLCATWLPIEAMADELDALINEASIDLSFRYRYEGVDLDNFSKDAQASTLRSRLSLQTGTYREFDLFVEIDDVHVLIEDDYNAGAGNTLSKTSYPVVADPEGTEVNQAFLDYNGIKQWRVRFGRQRINLDNQRFVGGVSWRQNEQTYDAVSTEFKNEQITGFYVYVANVNRIFSSDVSAGDHDQGSTHLFNISTKLASVGKLSGYIYIIDNHDAALFSTATYGARLSGNYTHGSDSASNPQFGYTLEFARQSDAGNNPAHYSASYLSLEGNLTIRIVTASIGWEVLSGDADSLANEAFRTPLATLHAFNGWADVFLTTPGAGLDDKYVKLKISEGSWILQARYHKFEAEDGNADYGDELNLRVGYKFNKRMRGDLFYASFDGDNGFANVSKFWLAVSLTL